MVVLTYYSTTILSIVIIIEKKVVNKKLKNGKLQWREGIERERERTFRSSLYFFFLYKKPDFK